MNLFKHAHPDPAHSHPMQHFSHFTQAILSTSHVRPRSFHTAPISSSKYELIRLESRGGDRTPAAGKTGSVNFARFRSVLHRDEIAISCRRISSSANGVLIPFCMEEKRNPAIRLCYHVATCLSSIVCHLRVCVHFSRPVRIASETISGITSSIQCWCDP